MAQTTLSFSVIHGKLTTIPVYFKYGILSLFFSNYSKKYRDSNNENLFTLRTRAISAEFWYRNCSIIVLKKNFKLTFVHRITQRSFVIYFYFEFLNGKFF